MEKEKIKMTFAVDKIHPLFNTQFDVLEIVEQLEEKNNLELDFKIVIPKKFAISKETIHKTKIERVFDVSFPERKTTIIVESIKYKNQKIYLIDDIEGSIYNNNPFKNFVYKSRVYIKGLLKFLSIEDFKSDFIYTNSNKGSLIPYFLKAFYNHIDFFKDVKTIFKTDLIDKEIRLFKRNGVGVLNLDPRFFENNDKILYSKLGVLFSDATKLSKYFKYEKSNKINLNKCSPKEISNIPRVGKRISRKIVKFRNRNGKFNDIEEVKKVKGLGNRIYNLLKNDVVV